MSEVPLSSFLLSLHRDFTSARKKTHLPKKEAAVDTGACEGDAEEDSEDDWEEVEGKALPLSLGSLILFFCLILFGVVSRTAILFFSFETNKTKMRLH